MTISLKSTVKRERIASTATKSAIDPPPRRAVKIAGKELTKRIVDPDALRKPSAGPPPESVSSIEPKAGLEVNMRTIERARKIFERLIC